MKIDYQLIRDMELISEDLLEWLDITMIDWLGKFGDRNIRLVGEKGHIIQVSVPVEKFDRWSNSVDIEYDVNKKEERDSFINFIESERN